MQETCIQLSPFENLMQGVAFMGPQFQRPSLRAHVCSVAVVAFLFPLPSIMATVALVEAVIVSLCALLQPGMCEDIEGI